MPEWDPDPLLRRLGLGVLEDAGDGASRAGRNDNRVGVTSTGQPVFVKRLDPAQPDAVARFRRLVRFERHAPVSGPLTAPPCLGWDEDGLIVVFAWLRDARSGSDLAKEEAFDDDLAHLAGRAVGALHALPLPLPLTMEDQPLLPPLDFFEALPLTYHTQASGASLEAWGLLQNDAELIAGLRELRREEAAAEHRPAHCDLRLDQFLRQGDALHLCDWEEFRPAADPARDIGGFVGEWLHRAVLDIPSQDPAIAGPAPQLSHRDVVERGVRELERLRTRNVAFWKGYREESGAVDPGLPARATAFAGWHLVDRMFAAAEQRPKLTALDRAAAGIGRTAVLRPARFAATLGLED
ncbi:class V lanthionine synthetase subunit LxmK [Streptomyces sp. NPDC059850]|uniref:class V lanthionine synthetase subunit LxmK n=1 Tax=Streptomyces sp. NPDC059850 TaxID=3346970 RepID=UPI00365B9D22